MVGEIKSRVQVHGKNTIQDLAKSITDMLWSYDSVKHVVKNNYVILNAIVRNTIKSLGINADNFNFETFNDNFDIYEIDTQSQDTLADSLAKVLSKFIIAKDNVDIAMKKAPYEIESRLKEIIDYLRKKPGDNETVGYAKELIQELKEFNRDLARKYESELGTILNPKPMVKVIESKPEVGNERTKEIEDTEYFLKAYMVYLSATPFGHRMFGYWREQCRIYIERLRALNPQLASKYERELNTLLYEKEKYANYGKKRKRERKVRIHHASYRITDFNETENADNDKREETARALEELRKQREAEIYSIEVVLFEIFRTLRDPRMSKYWNENIELAKSEIERLRKLDPERANKYERELNTLLYEKEKYANYGKETRTEYFNANETENADNDKRKVNDANTVDVSEILRPSPPPVKSDAKSKNTVERKTDLLHQITSTIAKDFANLYYYRGRY
jgi:hypothetical protein